MEPTKKALDRDSVISSVATLRRLLHCVVWWSRERALPLGLIALYIMKLLLRYLTNKEIMMHSQVATLEKYRISSYFTQIFVALKLPPAVEVHSLLLALFRF